MATQDYYVGSVGPLLYDDTDVYPDSVPMKAFRGPQLHIDNPPTLDNEVVRLVDVIGSLEVVWPVGSVFLSTMATNPATLMGFGTWQAFGAGRVLVGLDSGDVNFDAVEETGGSKTHKHAIDPPNTVSGSVNG
jgi:hypothetical protein